MAGTAEELREAFLNLLNNALDAMPAAGRFTFQVAAEGGRIVVRAVDTGCGMSEETRRRVFEAFFTTKGAQGNGLGLAAVWGSWPATVARSSLRPRSAGAPRSWSAYPSRSSCRRSRTPGMAPTFQRAPGVLLVEDNLEILRSLGDLLRDSGCRVVEAPDGTAALSRIHSEQVDLILTDLAMPGISGWEVATACRERFPSAPIGSSPASAIGSIPSASRHGIRFVVAKPFTSEEPLREVTAVLRKKARA